MSTAKELARCVAATRNLAEHAEAIGYLTKRVTLGEWASRREGRRDEVRRTLNDFQETFSEQWRGPMPLDVNEQHRANNNGLMALLEGLRSLALNPEIKAGEESREFVAALVDAVERSHLGELHAVLSTVDQSVRNLLVRKKGNVGKDAVKVRVAQWCREAVAKAKAKGAKPNLNDISRKAAGLAVIWNREAGCPFSWEDELSAYPTIRNHWMPKKK
ncbi:hypothetical protein HFQ13_03715 [Acidithiobacillus sp. VAN18-1]|uniref:Uncharacterized protein n=1 Tax=Igneacidithiobacillus copahuensis TaxID=2724909 RepID=A0AAE3CJF2_9PROT|nr:hypothetical protein [Igneacidithiobacillus copahuensis]MBU2787325.1 hypothetical protein [Igneacidithiobacillus copahuensis]MBU2797344.1 hypothetical protein [Acidithiobacillus sp. VAN18-2]